VKLARLGFGPAAEHRRHRQRNAATAVAVRDSIRRTSFTGSSFGNALIATPYFGTSLLLSSATTTPHLEQTSLTTEEQMRRVTNVLKNSLLSEPHLWIAVLSAIAFFMMELLHLWDWPVWMDPLRGVVHIVMVCILAIAADRLKEGEATRHNTERIRRIEDAVLAEHSALCSRPRHPHEFDEMWGGFTDIYCAYNPSYRLEELSGDDYVVSLLVQRFRNPLFRKARYLFLTHDRAGLDGLSRFRAVMLRVQNEWPGASKALQVRVVDERDAAPDAEMYIGTRDGKRVGILEMTDSALGGGHGAPNYYLVTYDPNVIEHYLQKHFDHAWAAGSPFDLFQEEVALLPARNVPSAGPA
jgi:hypothetical protein